jgi:hypothetical protein
MCNLQQREVTPWQKQIQKPLFEPGLFLGNSFNFLDPKNWGISLFLV